MSGFLELQKSSGGITDAFDPLTPEIVVENVTVDKNIVRDIIPTIILVA